LHKYLYTHSDPISYIDPNGEVAIFVLLGALLAGGIIGAGIAWTCGYDGWGIVAGAGIGMTIPPAAILGAPYYMPLVIPLITKVGLTSIGTLNMKLFISAIVSYAAVIGAVYATEILRGTTPTSTQQRIIDEAKELIRRTAGFSHYADWLDDMEVRVCQHDGWWGLAPHLTNQIIYVSDMLLANVPTVFVASTLVHEMHHALVELPVFQATGRGEMWAYQAQSRFIHFRGQANTSAGIKAVFPTYTSAHFDNYLTDQRDAFRLVV
jgi:hypothetical protein